MQSNNSDQQRRGVTITKWSASFRLLATQLLNHWAVWTTETFFLNREDSSRTVLVKMRSRPLMFYSVVSKHVFCTTGIGSQEDQTSNNHSVEKGARVGRWSNNLPRRRPTAPTLLLHGRWSGASHFGSQSKTGTDLGVTKRDHPASQPGSLAGLSTTKEKRKEEEKGRVPNHQLPFV